VVLDGHGVLEGDTMMEDDIRVVSRSGCAEGALVTDGNSVDDLSNSSIGAVDGEGAG
jgi:hypothetical protein